MHEKYFFVVDKVEKKELKIVYYSIEKMITDYSTKRTQDALFIYERNTILGIKEAWYKKKLEEYNL